MYRCCIAPHRASDVTGYYGRCTDVVLRHIERQMSLDIMADVKLSVVLRHIERQM